MEEEDLQTTLWLLDEEMAAEKQRSKKMIWTYISTSAPWLSLHLALQKLFRIGKKLMRAFVGDPCLGKWIRTDLSVRTFQALAKMVLRENKWFVVTRTVLEDLSCDSHF